MADGDIVIDTKINLTQLNQNLKDINAKVAEFGKETVDNNEKAGKSFSSLGNVAKAVLGTVAVKAFTKFAKAGISFNAEMEKYSTAMTVFTGSAEKTDKILQQLKDDALKTPFDVQGLAQGTQLLMSADISAKQAREDILNLGNAVVASGGGNDELQRMAFNLQQVKTQGKATSIDIRQFAMAGINIYKLLAEATGQPIEKVKEMDVTYQDLSKALKIAAEDGGIYAGAMEKASGNFNVAASNASAGIGMLASEIMKVPFEYLKEGLVTSSEKMGELAIATQEGGTAGFFSKFGEQLLDFVTNLPEKLNNFGDIGAKAIEKMGDGLVKSLPSIIEKVPQIINGIADGIYGMLGKFAIAGGKVIVKLGIGLIKNIPLIIKNAGQIVLAIINVLTLANMASIGKNLIKKLLKGVKGMGGSLTKTYQTLMTKAKNIIKKIPWKQAGKDIIKFLGNGIKSMGNYLWNTVKSLVSKALSYIKSKEWLTKGEEIIKNIAKGIIKGGANLGGMLISWLKDTFDIRKILGGGKNKKSNGKSGGSNQGNSSIGAKKAINPALYEQASNFTKKSSYAQFNKQIRNGAYSRRNATNSNSDNAINYKKLGGAIVDAFVESNISIDVNKRQVGRLVRGVM